MWWRLAWAVFHIIHLAAGFCVQDVDLVYIRGRRTPIDFVSLVFFSLI